MASHIKIGFSAASLAAALPKGPVIHLSPEMRAIYLEETRGSSSSLWLVIDSMDYDGAAITTLRDAAAQVLPGTVIHILTTHNHGGSTNDQMNMPELCRLTAETVASAKANACFAVERHCVTHPVERLNFIRRLAVPEVNGTTSFFYGPGPQEGYRITPFKAGYLDALKQGVLSYTAQCEREQDKDDARQFDAADDRIFIMEFAEEGTLRPLGSILRFAAHAVCCNCPGVFSADYPGYARQMLDEQFGGTAVFFNGPCADIAPGMSHKCDEEGMRVGHAVARAALAAIQSQEFVPVMSFADAARNVVLPVAEDVKNKTSIEVGDMPDELPGRKKYLERIRRNETLDFLWEKYANGEEKLSGTITVSLGKLQINDVTMLAFPGETFSTTAAAVGENIITVTEHGRTAMYMPPKDEYLKGGYESTCAVTAPGAEILLREAAVQFIKGN